MAGEWMIFEISTSHFNLAVIPVTIDMPSLDALQSFTHMVSVDKRPVPIFKTRYAVEEKPKRVTWEYFCIYDGMLIRALKVIEAEKVKLEVTTDGMAVNQSV